MNHRIRGRSYTTKTIFKIRSYTKEGHLQETSYTMNVIDKDDHIQDFDIEEVSYTRTVVYEDDHIP